MKPLIPRRPSFSPPSHFAAAAQGSAGTRTVQPGRGHFDELNLLA